MKSQKNVPLKSQIFKIKTSKNEFYINYKIHTNLKVLGEIKLYFRLKMNILYIKVYNSIYLIIRVWQN
jgi:hypothetical protein